MWKYSMCTWEESVSSVQSVSQVWLLRPHGLWHIRLPCPSPTPKDSQIYVQKVGDAIQPSHPLSSPSPPAFPRNRVFSKESVLRIRWLKFRNFSFNISPSNEYSRLISLRMDWLDLLAVQGNLKSLLWYQSSKALILWRSAFFIVQLSHPYMTTGKTKAWTGRTFVGKLMSLLFNMLSRLVIAFLPRIKPPFISWLVLTICSDFGAQNNKVCHCFPIYLPLSDGMPWS